MNKVRLFLLILLTVAIACFVGACGGEQGCGGSSAPQEQEPQEEEVLLLTYAQLDLELYEDFSGLRATNAKEAVTFSSSDASVATVTQDGSRISALKVGETTITATSGSLTATCKVRVVDNAILPVMSLENDALRLLIGDAHTNQASLTFKGVKCEGVVYSYTSSDTSVATVTDSGIVTALKLGNCIITVRATYKDVPAEYLTKVFTVEVVDDVSLSITNAEDFEVYTVENVNGQAFDKTVQANYAFVKDGQPYQGQGTFYWETQDYSVATVSATGLISGVSAGDTYVRVRYSGDDYDIASEWMPVTVLKPVVEVNAEALIDVTDKKLDANTSALFGSDEILKIVEYSEGRVRIEYAVKNGVVYGEDYYSGSDGEGNPIIEEKYLLGGDKDIEIHTATYALKMKGVVATKVITTAAELMKLHEYTKTTRLGTYEGYIVLGGDIEVDDSDYDVQYSTIKGYNGGKFFSCYYDLDLAECVWQTNGGSQKVFVFDLEGAQQDAEAEYAEYTTEELLRALYKDVYKMSDSDIETIIEDEVASATNESIAQARAELEDFYVNRRRKDRFGKQWSYADGQIAYSGQYAEGFNGTFDGRGYTISNLNVFMAGLFVRVGASGVIKNVAFDQMSLVGDGETYAICKYNSGVIDNVFVSVKTSMASGKKGTAICASLESVGTISNSVVYHNGISGSINANYRNAAFNEVKAGGNVSNLIVITDENRVVTNGMTKYTLDYLLESELNFSGFNGYWDLEGYKVPVFNGYSGNLPKNGLQTVKIAAAFGDIEQLGETTVKLNDQIIGNILSVTVNGVRAEGFTVSGDRKITIPANALKGASYGETTIAIETAEKRYLQPATLVTKILKTKEDIANIHSFVKTATKGVYDGYLVLGNDIDMDGVEYIVPSDFENLFNKGYAGLCPYSDADVNYNVLEKAEGFTGILDGRGHSIKNLNIFIYGIFYRNKGTIRNIAIASNFKQPQSATLAFINDGTIDNVFIYVEVLGELWSKGVYGFVRDNNGTISNSVIRFMHNWEKAAPVAMYVGDNAQFINVIAHTTSTNEQPTGVTAYGYSSLPTDATYSGFNTDYWDTTTYKIPLFKGNPFNLPNYTK